MTKQSEPPELIKQAASRIAGTALGPFIMGERRVDLEALEQRINERVIEEMHYVLCAVIATLATTSIVVVMEDGKPQLKAEPKKRKAQNKRADTTRDSK